MTPYRGWDLVAMKAASQTDGPESHSQPALSSSSPVISGFTPVNLSTHQHMAEPTEGNGPRAIRPTGTLHAQTVAPKRPHQLGTPPPTTTKRSRRGAYPRPCPKQPSKRKSSNSGNNGIAQTLRVTKASKWASMETEFKQPREVSVSTRLSEHTLRTLAAFKYQPEEAKGAYDVENGMIFECMTSAAKSPHQSKGKVADTTDPISVYRTTGILVNECGTQTRTHAVSTGRSFLSIEAVHSRSTGSVDQITRTDFAPSIQADQYAYHSDTFSSSGTESFGRAVTKSLVGAQKTETNQSTSGRNPVQDQGSYKDMNGVSRESRLCDDSTNESETSDGRNEQFFTNALFEHKTTPISSQSMLLGYGEFDKYSEDFPIGDLGTAASPHANDVQESFEPPSSLQLSYDDHDQTSGTYDPNMQRSSPHSERTVRSPQVGEEFPIGQRTTVNTLRSSVGLFSAYEESSSNTVIENEMENGYDGELLDREDDFEEEEDFLDDELDAGVLDLADKASQESRRISLASFEDVPTTPKLQWRAPQLYKSTRSSPIFNGIHGSSPVRKSLVPTLIEPHPQAEQNKPLAKHLIAFDPNGKALPFARPAFPTLIQDRSPILGISSSSCLRSCFRIGEALNAATIASHTNMHHLTELYARVTYSKRDGVEQFFQFADLFRPERPPYLNGSYMGWKGSDLWEKDTKSFLGDLCGGKVARCIGKMKRDGATKGWKMVVFNIREATWEDIGYVKGIVCA